MDESDLGITEKSKDVCSALLQEPQAVPTESLFRDDIFRRTCRNIQDRNEARVQDIVRLIVPSARPLLLMRSLFAPEPVRFVLIFLWCIFSRLAIAFVFLFASISRYRSCNRTTFQQWCSDSRQVTFNMIDFSHARIDMW